MTQLLIADVYLRPPRTEPRNTTPGRRLDFRGGHTQVWDERDMLFVLKMPDAVIKPVERFYSHIPIWIGQCGELTPAVAELDMHDKVFNAQLLVEAMALVAEQGVVVEVEPDPVPDVPLKGWEPAPEPEPDPLGYDAITEAVEAEILGKPKSRGRPRKG